MKKRLRIGTIPNTSRYLMLILFSLCFGLATQAQIGAGLRLVDAGGADEVADNLDGTYTASFQAEVENFENSTLFDVQIFVNLSTAAGGDFGTYNSIATMSGDLSDGEYYISGVEDRLGDIDVSNTFDGDTNTGLLDQTSSFLDSGDDGVVRFFVTFRPPLVGDGIYNTFATASGDNSDNNVADGDFTDLSFDLSPGDTDLDPNDDDNPEESDPTVIVLCQPNDGCAPGQSSLGWNDSGWNNGAGWTDADNTNPQTWMDFDGNGTNVTATPTGTFSSFSTSPNVYGGGNKFGCRNSLRLAGTGVNSSGAPANLAGENIAFTSPIAVNSFIVGGMEANRSSFERAEVSILSFSNGGTPVDPNTFTYTELTPSDVAFEISGTTLYVYGLQDNNDGVLFIDLGGTLIDEIDWKIGEVSDNTVGADNFVLNGTVSSMWISSFCYGSSCVNPTSTAQTTMAGTCDMNDMLNMDATITIDGIMNGDIVGISSAGASSYDGNVPDYNADASTDPDLHEVSGGSVTFSGLMQGEDYTVRVFNADNNCFTDYTVTTAATICTTLDCPGGTSAAVGDLFGDRNPREREVIISLPAGDYNLNVKTFDNRSNPAQVQDEEQVFIEFYDASDNLIATSGVTDDVPDGVAMGMIETDLGTITLGSDVARIIVKHVSLQNGTNDSADSVDGVEICLTPATPALVAIGNLVFMDNNDNGSFESGTDMGLDNVVVQLFRDGDDPTSATPAAPDVTTSGGGFYEFDNLTPGMYFVYIPASEFGNGEPLFNKVSSAPEGGDDMMDDNADENGGNTLVGGGIASGTINLQPGDEPTGEVGAGNYTGSLPNENVNFTVDFGFRIEKVAVGNYVFMDNDDDGVFSAGDMAIPDVDLQLLKSYEIINGRIDLDRDGVTNGDIDDDGTIDGIAIIDGRVDIDGNGNANGNGTLLDVDIINGFVDIDDNGSTSVGTDRALDDGFLTDFDTPVDNQTTDANGYYYFDELDPCEYAVYVIPSNFTGAGALVGKENSSGATDDDTTDDDDNGIDEPVDGGIISNVFSLDPNQEPTNEGGQGGSGGTTAYMGDLDDDNVNETIDFSFRNEKVAVGNYVFMDNDDNGVFSAGDMGIEDVTVQLIKSFEVIDGQIDVNSDGVVDLDDDGVIDGVNIINGRPDINGDNITGGPLDMGTIAGVGVNNAFVDADGNGSTAVGANRDMDDGFLSDTNAPLQTETTDASGYYYFDQLNPCFYAVYIPSSNFADGTGALDGKESSPGTTDDDTTDDDDNGIDEPVDGGIISNVFELTPNNEPTNEGGQGGSGGTTAYMGDLDDDNVNETIDFSFRNEKVAIGNLVFMDNNDNGSFESGTDMALDGVVVQLFRAGDDPTSAIPAAPDVTTSGGGFYLFDELDPGMYFVYIPASEFTNGEPLFNKVSSAPEGGDDMMDDNADENGVNTLVGGGIASGTIDLQPGDEPTGEAGEGNYTGSLPDENVNFTVDFGFQNQMFDLALIIQEASTPSNGMFYQPNEAIEFKITVENQGMVAASDITVTNYIPAEFLGEPIPSSIMLMAIGGGASTTTGTPTITRSDNGTNAQNDDFTIELGDTEGDWLQPGDLLMFNVTYSLSPIANPGQDISIFAEISENDDDNNAGTTPIVDKDSTPDDDNNTGAGEDANLEDNVLNEDVKANPATDDEDDHDIEVIEGDAILPVELLSFKVIADKDHIDLVWSTATETNNSHFDLERSEDGKTFKAIRRMQGQGTTLTQTDYNYEDREAIPNVLYYYRLKQVDFDGEFEYSNIRTAQLDEEAKGDMNIYPNPIGNDQRLQVRFFAKEAAADFVVVDILNRPVLSVQQDLNATGWNTISIDISSLSAGTYVLMNAQGEVKKFIVSAD